jgi:8-amino-7-oxononanoate synthase
MKDLSLYARLSAALTSREDRLIRRRLPDPNTAVTSATATASQGVVLIDFNSNDYLSLSTSPVLRDRYLQKLKDAPDILGSGGSRLLVNGRPHSGLEKRLGKFFRSESALLFNSGFDANVGFFSCIPQPGDVVVYDEYIHASVHDGIRSSRAKGAQFLFKHNSVESLRSVLVKLLEERPELRSGENSVFVAVESLYSMDGTFSPLAEIVQALEAVFPKGNAHLVVDEAHATGIYGPQGRGRVAQLGLESKVLARLHTFGKALAASGGAYGRSLFKTHISFLSD